MRILAVDDDPIILGLLEEYLTEQEGFHLASYPNAESGLEALNAAQHPFDCIILDIMLPGMNGIALCELVRNTKRYHSVPILMITGSQELDLMAQAFDAGATDFVTKPFRNPELLARVQSSSLLNRSLAKANHIMGELTALMKIRFGEAIALEVDGLSDVLALENELLRSRAERFSMSLYNLSIDGLRGIYQTTTPIAYRHCLAVIGTTAVLSTHGAKNTLAYAGSGRFVGTHFDRQRMDCDAMTKSFNTQLAERWDPRKAGVMTPPTGQFNLISSQRMWSGTSAGEQLRAFLSADDNFDLVSGNDETNLFSRLDTELRQST